MKLKILDSEIVINEDFYKYTDFCNKKQSALNKHRKYYETYHIANINTMDDFRKYVVNFYDYMQQEYLSIAKEALKILIDNQIFDKTIDDILLYGKYSIEYEKYMLSKFENLKEIYQDRTSKLEEIENLIRKKAESNYQMNTDIYISDPWTLTFLEAGQERENRRINKQRQLYYNVNVKRMENKLNKIFDNMAEEFYVKFKEEAYYYTELVIHQIFENCFNILIQENKLSKNIFENLQVEKSSSILKNIKEIQDEKVKNEQLIVALESNLLSLEVHKTILETILRKNKESIEEYLELIRFINIEDILFEICINNILSNISNSKKYIELLKLLERNKNEYLIKILDNIDYTTKDNILEAGDNVKILCNFLYEVWPNSKTIIDYKKNKLFKLLIYKIEENFKCKNNNASGVITYDDVKRFYEEAKKNHEVQKEENNMLKLKLKKVKRKIVLTIILGIISYYIALSMEHKFVGNIYRILLFYIYIFSLIIYIIKLVRDVNKINSKLTTEKYKKR